ncbi:hypothetical protein KEM52_000671, partial [Ascosphaera acerosa]
PALPYVKPEQEQAEGEKDGEKDAAVKEEEDEHEGDQAEEKKKDVLDGAKTEVVERPATAVETKVKAEKEAAPAEDADMSDAASALAN